MKKEKYELSSQYMKDLKKLLKARKVTPYDIAHKSFRKNCAHWIIDNVDKRSLEITYLNGDKKEFLSYNELMKEVKIVNGEYKKGITDEENTDFTLSDYEKLFDILIRFYTEKQLEKIWGILQEYDAKILKLKNK